VITPRQTRLLRVAGLAGLRHLLTRQVAALDPIVAADTFMLVPTRAAAEQLRRAVEDRLLDAQAVVSWPRTGPRSDLYRELVSRTRWPLDLLSPFDREVILGRIAREVAASGLAPPFAIRPALVAEMVALYDHVRRQARTVDDFDRNLRAELEPAVDTDRGAAQLLRQTAFLSAVFAGYERHLEAQGLVDEHGIRAALVAEPSARPLRHVVVTVADRVADPDGLWPVDFTLLSTLPLLERVDVVATEAMLAAGWLERIHAALPGLEDVPADQVTGMESRGAGRPTLIVPNVEGPPLYQSRDREEELAQVARRIKAARHAGDTTPLHRHALVVRRPLPYLYLARSVFGGAGVPFETLDTLPLAAEPYAAALDLVLDFVASGFSRVATVALLRSPHFRFDDGAGELSSAGVSALDRALAESRYLGGLERLERLAGEWSEIAAPGTRDERRRHTAAPAARVAVALAQSLRPLVEAGAVASQLALLRDFLARHHREPGGDTDLDRLARVRRAVTGAVGALGRAYREHDPGAVATGGELASAIRRWLGAQTFAARTGVEGIRLLDAQAARFADVDDVQLVGLVDGEWPERSRRSIFYPPFLLGLLDPTPAAEDPNKRESDQTAAARAMFLDLVGLAGRCVRVSAFALESDAVVEPSTFVDDLATVGLERRVEPPVRDLAVSADEALTQMAQTPQMTQMPQIAQTLGPLAWKWAERRAAAPGPGDARYQGEAGPWTFARISVSRIDRYLKCPFQFFASEVLKLEEEPEDEDAPPPWERGRFLHALFETFFREWQARGYGSITADRVPEAREMLIEASERALATLAPTEATLERARLFGSAAGAGIIDRVLSMEAERPAAIDRRLIEFELDDVFVFRRESGETRTVPLRAKVDRVDLLADGTFRVIDYKSKHVPDLKRTVQLQVYTSAVAQQLEKAEERHHTPAEAFYLSMEGDSPIRALKAPRGQSLDDVLRAAEDRMVQAIDDAGAGHFPPRPVPRSLCSLCPYDTVCRKAFVEVADE
jgi:RecB family exonuclease